MHYRVISIEDRLRTGKGKTVRIGSRELSFIADDPPHPEQLVEVAVEWLVRLDHVCPLKLVICGRVIQLVDTEAVVAIQHYEFRTQRSQEFHRLSDELVAPTRGDGHRVPIRMNN